MSQSNLRICPPVSHKFISLWASTADVIAPASRPNADDILMIKLSVHYLVGHRSSDDRYFIRLFPLPRRPTTVPCRILILVALTSCTSLSLAVVAQMEIIIIIISVSVLVVVVMGTGTVVRHWD